MPRRLLDTWEDEADPDSGSEWFMAAGETRQRRRLRPKLSAFFGQMRIPAGR